MGRNTSPSQIDEAATATTTTVSSTTSSSSATNAVANGGNGNNNNNNSNDQGCHLIRDRFRFKRNPCHISTATASNQNRAAKSSVHRPSLPSRWHHNTNRSNCKGFLFWFPFRGAYLLYFVIFFAVFAFAMASIVLKSSITSMVFSQGCSEDRKWIREGLRLGSTFKFLPGRRSLRLLEGHGLDQLRLQRRVGLRPPRLAVILGSMKKDPQSLLLATVMKNLQKLGYMLKIYAIENVKAQSEWDQMGFQISILQPEQYDLIDWSMYIFSLM